MKPRLDASQGRVIRALALYLSKDGENLMKGTPDDGLIVESMVSRPWASLTFTGERHHLVVRLPRGCAELPIDGTGLRVADAIVAVERAAWSRDSLGTQLALDLIVLDERF